MRVIYPLEEERLRKGKPAAWMVRWWARPLDWFMLLSMLIPVAGFSVMPLALLVGTEKAPDTVVFALVSVQVCVSLGCIWLFMRASEHARIYAQHGVRIASNIAARLGLFLGHGLVLAAVSLDALSK